MTRHRNTTFAEHLATDPPLLARDDFVNELRMSLSSTKHGLGTVPNAIKFVIRDGM